MAVLFATIQPDLITFAKSPPGITVGSEFEIPHLNPVGAQSTNVTVFFPFIFAMLLLTSFGTTSPRNIKQHDMYFPFFASHLTIIFADSNNASLISPT